MYEIGDKVTVLKTGYEGRIVWKKEFFDKITYVVHQSNGHDIEASEDGLRKAK